VGGINHQYLGGGTVLRSHMLLIPVVGGIFVLALTSCADTTMSTAPDLSLVEISAPSIVLTCAFPEGSEHPELEEEVTLPEDQDRLAGYKAWCERYGGHLVADVIGSVTEPSGRPNVWIGPLPAECEEPEEDVRVVDARGTVWSSDCFAAQAGVRVTWDL